MFKFESKNSSNSLEKFLDKISGNDVFNQLSRYGQEGVNALAAATPKDSALTASSWTYEILKDGRSWSIIWSNTNVVDGTPVAILLQYGHGTGTGGYVEGRDYINPAIRPIFDRMANEAWKAVTK